MSSVDDDAISRRLRDFPEIEARVSEIPPEIATDWPGARRVSLALGEAMRLSIMPSEKARERLRKAASRLVREPEVRKAAERAVAIAKRMDRLTAERDRDHRRRLTFERQARLFATAHRFPYLSPRDVARLLAPHFAAVFRGEDGPLPLPEWPTMYVNPLTDAELSARIPPGHILVDLTHATDADLQALSPALREAQRRLRYDRRGGGPDPHCMNRIRLVIRQFKGVEPPGLGEVARVVYARDDPQQSRDAYRKCLDRNNTRHEDVLREAGWSIPNH